MRMCVGYLWGGVLCVGCIFFNPDLKYMCVCVRAYVNSIIVEDPVDSVSVGPLTCG